MKRENFVKAYARASCIDTDFAKIGMISFGEHARIALPCACGEPSCVGWAMLSVEHVLHHLQFDAPEKLRKAYLEAVAKEEGEPA
jgi:hypothetical protein